VPDSALPVNVTLGFAVVASSVASTAAFRAVQGPHTRALALVLFAFAVTALLRVGAWELGTIAGERASASLYAGSRAISTFGVGVEAAGQLAAAVWIGTRSRSGLLLSALSAAGAFAATWGASLGSLADSPRWASVLHASLADAAATPAPYGLGGASSFLAASGVLLATAALLQLAQPAPIAAAFALALVSRGAFDAPLRALAVAAAAQWAVVAAVDPRLFWASVRPAPGAPPNPRRTAPS
jgi:hypothetical protein